MSSQSRLPSILVIVLSALFFVSITGPLTNSFSFWGLNYLSYFDWSVRLPVAIASVLCAFVLVTLGSQLKLNRAARNVLLYIAIPALLLMMFYILRVNTHYLGDGILRMRELGIGVWWLPTEPLAQAVNFFAYKITASTLGFDETAAVELVSYLGGLFYYYALIRFVRVVSSDTLKQILIFVLLYFSGTTLLFCGYAETYMLLPGLITLFFTAGIKSLRAGKSPIFPSLLFLLLVLFHFKSLMFAPCIALLAYYQFKDNQRSHALVSIMAIIAAFALTIILPAFSPLPTLSAAGFMMPLSASAGSEYTLFSAQHLLDILNEILLTAAAAAIVIVAAITARPKSSIRGNKPLLFVAAGLPGALAMLFLLHSRLGFAIDWDLFSSATIIIGFFAAMLFAQFESLSLNKAAAIALGAVGFLSFFSFAAVNSKFETAVQRQVDVLSIYGKDGAIGYETMANHLNSIGQSDLAEQLWKKSLFLRPHVRIYANLAQLSLNQGRVTDAKYYSEKGLSLDSTQAALWNHHGVAMTRYGDFAAAEASLRNAIRFSPNEGSYHHNFSLMLAQAKRWPEAEAESRIALNLQPRDPSIMTALGIALTNTGKLTEAEDILAQVTTIAPSFGEPYLHLSHLYLIDGDTVRTKLILSEYLKAFPNSPTAGRMKQVLDQLNR